MVARNIIADVRSNSSVKRAVFVKRDDNPLGFNVYPVECCDLCGAECIRPDGPTYHAADRATVNRLSMQADAIGNYPEIGACDALGGIAVCPDCYTDAEPTADENEATQPTLAPSPVPAPDPALAALLAVSDMPRHFAEEINRALRQTGRNSVAAWWVIASGLNND